MIRPAFWRQKIHWILIPGINVHLFPGRTAVRGQVRETKIGERCYVWIIRRYRKPWRAGAVAPISIPASSGPARENVLIVGGQKDALPASATVGRLIDDWKLDAVLPSHISGGDIVARHPNKERKVIRDDSGDSRRPIRLTEIERVDPGIARIRSFSKQSGKDIP